MALSSLRAASSAAGSKAHGPERSEEQGLTADQSESGNQAILALLRDPEVRDQVDLVITYREDAYEVWAARGMVRFRRHLALPGEEEAGSLRFEAVEVIGENPLENQDPHALRSLAEECEAARASGHDPSDPSRRFIRAEHQSYPFAYERVAQLFDSPNAPDLVISPNDWSFGLQPGQHGALHVRQSRAPLWFSGPGIRVGTHELCARATDIAPTALAALGFPKVDGADASGRRASERGASPDVYLGRQDGRVLEEILDSSQKPPKWLYLFLIDGLHPTALEESLEEQPARLPNLRRLLDRAAVVGSGSIVNFPSITWPSHTCIATGTWCGHHDVVNPSYYLRRTRKSVSPQGQQVHSEGFSNPEVESLYEAFTRVRGEGTLTAAIHAPCGRGAQHAVLEGRNLAQRERMKAMAAELARDECPRWREDGAEEPQSESRIDARGIAQVIDLFDREDQAPPDFVFHELVLTDGVGHYYGPHSQELHEALAEGDRRIGRVLDAIEKAGRFEETLFIVTADHGMAPQDTALRANPARHVEGLGLEAEVAEPMIWLRDLAALATRAGDGRTARVVVCENDRDEEGERPEVVGAAVEVWIERPGAERKSLCSGQTGEGGAYGFATPAQLESSELLLEIQADGFNRRALRLDGRSTAIDLRRALYGDRA